MPKLSRKRPAEDAEDNDESSASVQQGRRKRVSRSPESDARSYSGSDADEGASAISTAQLAKKFVRYALSCEYARQPIKRADITTKVLQGAASRHFKPVFAEANLTLQSVFGMELIELPMREKVTTREKRKAQQADKAPTSSKSWILASTLEPKYRTAAIIRPSQAPSEQTESAYVGLYTMVVAVISLAGGSLPEGKLDRYLQRMNAERNTPLDSTKKTLERMQKDGYLVRKTDNSSGEQVVEYMVGPRGKVEVGQDGVAELVKVVYGGEAPSDLEKRLERSLGLGERREPRVMNGNAPNGTQAVRKRGRPKRNARDPDEDDEGDGAEESDEDDED